MSEEKEEAPKMALTAFDQMLERHGYASVEQVPEVAHFSSRELFEVLAEQQKVIEALESRIEGLER